MKCVYLCHVTMLALIKPSGVKQIWIEISLARYPIIFVRMKSNLVKSHSNSSQQIAQFILINLTQSRPIAFRYYFGVSNFLLVLLNRNAFCDHPSIVISRLTLTQILVRCV